MSEIVPGLLEPETEPPRSKGTVALAWLREILIVVIGALIASTLIKAFLLQMFQIPSESMENTLLKGDRVAVQKVVPFERGDVVVFRDTLGWLHDPVSDPNFFQRSLIFVGLAEDNTSNYLIKRVIGTEGDRVACCDNGGRLTVNGVSLSETEYLYRDPTTGVQVNPSDVSFDVVVPKGRIFVMGDHRNNSADSRVHLDEQVGSEPIGMTAFVPVENVQGAAVAVVFPFNRFTTFSRPETFTGVPEPTSIPDAPIIDEAPTAR
ncbi:MAG: signal peptidase I [Propionibacteriaceae bacterium]|jgi:signal peptidase I|nr:signal peptidase I [Propionibacteriaceae bacterium]